MTKDITTLNRELLQNVKNYIENVLLAQPQHELVMRTYQIDLGEFEPMCDLLFIADSEQGDGNIYLRNIRGADDNQCTDIDELEEGAIISLAMDVMMQPQLYMNAVASIANIH